MKKLFLIIITFSLVFTACKKEEGCTNIAAVNYDVIAEKDNGSCKYNLTISFTHTIDGDPLEINQMIYTNAAGENYNIQTLRYLMSDITLHSGNGASILVDEVHFVTIAEYNFLIPNCTITLCPTLTESKKV